MQGTSKVKWCIVDFTEKCLDQHLNQIDRYNNIKAYTAELGFKSSAACKALVGGGGGGYSHLKQLQ